MFSGSALEITGYGEQYKIVCKNYGIIRLV